MLRWEWGAKTVIGLPLSLLLHPWLHWKLVNLQWGMSYLQALSSSISSGAGFGTHYYQSFLRGRGLLFSNQQLMANEESSRLVRAYASNDWLIFWMDFAQVMLNSWGCQVLMFWLDLKVWFDETAPWPWLVSKCQSGHNELLRSLFFHIIFSYVLCLIVDAVTSKFLSVLIIESIYKGNGIECWVCRH